MGLTRPVPLIDARQPLESGYEWLRLTVSPSLPCGLFYRCKFFACYRVNPFEPSRNFLRVVVMDTYEFWHPVELAK